MNIIEAGIIDRSDTMYPTIAWAFDKEQFDTDYGLEKCSTVYGYVAEGILRLPNDWIVTPGHWFSYAAPYAGVINAEHVSGYMVMRLGYKGQTTLGGPIEDKGRLSYIDGCSDTLLVYPPRLGDPSLNHLYFPAGIDQSFHTHPSIRMGFVARGEGVAELSNGKIKLKQGMTFCLDEQELHRFKTNKSEMHIIAFHPDGDWGPTDQNHTMLNRTYLARK